MTKDVLITISGIQMIDEEDSEGEIIIRRMESITSSTKR